MSNDETLRILWFLISDVLHLHQQVLTIVRNDVEAMGAPVLVKVAEGAALRALDLRVALIEYV